MKFNNLGKIIYNNKVFDAIEIRSRINKIKTFISNNIEGDEIVAVAVRRSERLICTIFALIECNVTFLPIDLNLPQARVKYMLQKANVKNIIVSSKEQYSMYGEYNYIIETDIEETTYITTRANYSLGKERPVYILYTSGSTGNPKAVTVTYKGFINFLKAVPEIIKFNRNEKIGCFTSVSFDIFFLEAVLGLVSGLTLVLANEEEHNNAKAMIELIKKYDIEILQMTPSRMQLLITYSNNNLDYLKSVNTLMIGGEKLTDEFFLLLKSKINARIYNMYGPTETTIWSSISDLTQKDIVDIGKPIKNTNIYILKDRKSLAVIGEEGEICIGGIGVAEGYYNEEELTEKNFINLPIEPYERVYCTGDIGKYDSNGNLFYIGRQDTQVKVRGYRIELEEIEEKIKRIEGIFLALVCYDEDNHSIVAFYIGKNTVREEQIRNYLLLELPEYMVPSKIFKVNEFIYTIGGKADRKAMIKSLNDNSNAKKKIIDIVSLVDLDSIEEKVIKIISDILEEENENILITRETKLDRLGMHSLRYIKIVVALENEFEFEFDEECLKVDVFDNINCIIDYVKGKVEKG